MTWTLVVLIWLSPLFGGEGLEGRPTRATLEFPTESGCLTMTRELKGYKLKHEILQPCAPSPEPPEL